MTALRVALLCTITVVVTSGCAGPARNADMTSPPPPPAGGRAQPGTPSGPPSPHDGVIRGNGTYNLELVHSASAPRVDIYLLDLAERPVAIDGLELRVSYAAVSGTMRWHTLLPKGNHFELPWPAADGEMVALDVRLVRQKPAMNQHFDVRMSALPSAQRKDDAATKRDARVAGAVREGVLGHLDEVAKIDGVVPHRDPDRSQGASGGGAGTRDSAARWSRTAASRCRSSLRQAPPFRTGRADMSTSRRRSSIPPRPAVVEVSSVGDSLRLVMRKSQEPKALWEASVRNVDR